MLFHRFFYLAVLTGAALIVFASALTRTPQPQPQAQAVGQQYRELSHEFLHQKVSGRAHRLAPPQLPGAPPRSMVNSRRFHRSNCIRFSRTRTGQQHIELAGISQPA
jgi:hypothetical protein